jgi:hypothetical protein
MHNYTHSLLDRQAHSLGEAVKIFDISVVANTIYKIDVSTALAESNSSRRLSILNTPASS